MIDQKAKPPEQLDFFTERSADTARATDASGCTALQNSITRREHLTLVASRKTMAPQDAEDSLLDAVLRQAAKLGW